MCVCASVCVHAYVHMHAFMHAHPFMHMCACAHKENGIRNYVCPLSVDYVCMAKQLTLRLWSPSVSLILSVSVIKVCSRWSGVTFRVIR